jgi:CxxC motif-containing protein
MSKHNIICILCPLGCRMEAEAEGGELLEIKGNQCKQGINHARQEVLAPVRVLTTTVMTDDPRQPLLPVRSDRPLPRARLEESMRTIAGYTVKGPVCSGDVIIRDIFDTGVNIIASRSLPARPH